MDAYYKMFECTLTTQMVTSSHHTTTNCQWREGGGEAPHIVLNSVQYHTANSLIKFNDWKFEEGIKEASLSPRKLIRNSCWHTGLYAWYVLYAHGDADTALREYQIAEQLDPSDMIIQNVLWPTFHDGTQV